MSFRFSLSAVALLQKKSQGCQRPIYGPFLRQDQPDQKSPWLVALTTEDPQNDKFKR